MNAAARSTAEVRLLGILALLTGLLLNPGSVSEVVAGANEVDDMRLRAAVVAGQIALVGVGVWLLLREPAPRGAPLVRRTAGALLLAGAGVGGYGVARWVANGGPSAVRGPNVVLIVLDTTRRDRLSLYGYERETSPALDRLAAESVVYDDAYATSSWTAPSHASLFTGLYPAAHRVTQASWQMGAELETLAERVLARGYRTAGIVGNPMVGRSFGFDQGFEEYHETWREPRADGADHPALVHLRAFLDAEDERPFFAFLNFIEAHSPYTSGEEFLAEFVRQPELELVNNEWRDFYVGLRKFDTRELEHLGDVYDAGLRYLDGLVGLITADLRARGLLDETVLVVTSDHGENLGEHALVDHVFSLYEQTVQIPLLIRYPAAIAGEPSRARGVRVGAPVQLTDVYVTLANLTGVDPGPAQGFDLRTTVLSADRPILLSYDYPAQALKAMRERANDPLLDKYRRRLWALREGDVKVILDDDGSLELYDLGADPGELADVAGEDVERAEAKRRRLLELIARYSRQGDADRPADDVDEETRAMLEKLGYL